ncbi:MAG: 50S ribosomal protein L10 [Gammaproteobacteria bacterium]|jgi:large subunit ribosomal protein L10|nr:50S ribosomal protein L10 [Gammaproteobacteria bacterium]MBD07911.1 50S ribosomal protein L10 [Gammaproteobacteria bacterium]|tara:strand:+ start:245 stop:766 length:522 start_codon:yes stop_codon:yes gene_type:complete
MALSLDQKKELVAEVHSVAASAHSAVAAEYRGLSVGEMTELRVEARNSGVYIKVVKNSLARLAVEGTEFKCMQEHLKGPLLLAFSKEDPGSAARVIKGFSKDNDKLVTVSVSIGGELYDAGDLDRLAALPNLDEARGMFLRTLNGPLTQLVRVLAEPAGMLARTIQARGEQTE